MSWPNAIPLSGKRSLSWWLRAAVARIPVLLVVAVAAVAFWLLPHGTSFGSSSVRGFAEAVDIGLGPIEPSRIESVDVVIGQKVKAGQIVARMHRGLLDAHRARLAAEADQAEARVSAEQQEQEAEVTRGELWVLRARANERSDRAELKEILPQVKRLEALAADKMIPATDAEDRRRTRDSLAARVAAYDSAIQHGHAGLQRRTTDTADHMASVEARVAPYRLALRAEQAAVAEVDVKLEECSIRAPSDGIVSTIVHRPGEVIPAGEPVISIVASRPGVIIVSIPDRLARNVVAGATVSVRRDSLFDRPMRARVIEVAPEIDQVPLRSRASPGIATWGRRVALLLEDGSPLLPGEAFHVRF